MATPYKATVESILEAISDYRGENTTNTDARRIRAVSRSEGTIAQRTNWELNQINNQTITSTGVATYTVGSTDYPLREKGMIELFVDGTAETNRYTICDAKTFKQLYNDNPLNQLYFVEYVPATDIWQVTISPTPETGITITYSYFWTPPERTLTTDSVVCIDMEALARLALAEVYDGEDEPEKAAIERNKVEQILSGAQQIDDGPATGQTYVDSGNNSSGIGNY